MNICINNPRYSHVLYRITKCTRTLQTKLSRQFCVLQSVSWQWKTCNPTPNVTFSIHFIVPNGCGERDRGVQWRTFPFI